MSTVRRYFRDAIARASVVALLASILGLSPWVAGQDRAKLERPVMMDSNGPGTDLFVVDESGILHKFHVTQNSLEEYGSAPLPAEFTPADMAFAGTGERDSLLIAGTEAGHGALVRYSVDGIAVETWAFHNICSGIDFSTAKHTGPGGGVGHEESGGVATVGCFCFVSPSLINVMRHRCERRWGTTIAVEIERASPTRH